MVLLTAIGLRKTFRLIIQYPGIIFIAIFSFWTVGPVRKSESKICCQLFKQEKLGISSKHTWINFSLSLGCSVATSVLLFFDQNVDKQNFILGWSVLVPMIMILLITLVSLLHGDSLNNFWCCCFQQQYHWCVCCKNCVATKYSVLNLATMEEDTEMQEIMNKTPNFEEQENGSHSRKHCINFSQLFHIKVRSFSGNPLQVLRDFLNDSSLISQITKKMHLCNTFFQGFDPPIIATHYFCRHSSSCALTFGYTGEYYGRHYTETIQK